MAEITIKEIVAELVESEEVPLTRWEQGVERKARCEYEIFLLEQQQNVHAIYALCRRLMPGEERYYAKEPERLLRKREGAWLILEKDGRENLSGLKAKLAALSQSIEKNLST